MPKNVKTNFGQNPAISDTFQQNISDKFLQINFSMIRSGKSHFGHIQAYFFGQLQHVPFQVPTVLEAFPASQGAMVLLLCMNLSCVKIDSHECQGPVPTPVTAMWQVGIVLLSTVDPNIPPKVRALVTLDLKFWPRLKKEDTLWFSFSYTLSPLPIIYQNLQRYVQASHCDFVQYELHPCVI